MRTLKIMTLNPIVLFLTGLFFFSVGVHDISHAEGDSKVAKSVPMGNGGSSGTITPDLFTGTMSYSVPIKVPEGRKGMSPGLSLDYKSNNGNGWVGMGWELEVGAIERSMKGGLNYSGDDYVLRIAGGAMDLVNIGGNEYRAKIEGAFYRIVKYSNFWIVYDKMGMKYTFGQTAHNGGATPRQDDPYDDSRVFKWCLDKVEDTNGNFMTFTYTKTPLISLYIEHGNIYLDRIDYAGHSNGLQPSYYVKFHLETRTDAPDMYNTNFKTKTAYRLKTIEVKANGNAVSAYKLSYHPYSASPGRSLLASVQQYGKDATFDASWTVTGGSALPETRFVQQLGGTNFVDAGAVLTDQNLTYSPGGVRSFAADFNGDGRADILRSWDSPELNHLFLGVANGFVDAGPVLTEQLLEHTNRTVRSFIADFNGDGKADILSSSDSPALNHLFRGAESGFEDAGAVLDDQTLALSNGAVQSFIADFNGDGKADILRSWDSPELNHLFRGTESGFEDAGAVLTDQNLTYSPGGVRSFVADFNGDGKADILRSWDSPALNHLFLGAANGFVDAGPVLTEQLLEHTNRTVRSFIADFNGDGKADILRSCDSPGLNRLFLGTGNGFVDAGDSAVTVLIDQLLGLSAGGVRSFVADFNGDGRADILRSWDSPELNHLFLGAANGFVDAGPVLTDETLELTNGAVQSFIADFSGDGKPDILRSWDTPSLNRLFFPSGVGIPDLLIQISNGLGGATTIAYTSSTYYTNALLPFPIQTVNSVTTCDNYTTSCIGNLSTTNYAYSHGYFHISESDFRGFNQVAVTTLAPNGNQKITETWFHQGNETTVLDENIPQETLKSLASAKPGYMKGKPYRTKVRDQQGHIYSSATMSYFNTDPTHTYSFTPLAQVDAFSCDGGSSVCDANGYGRHTQTKYYYDGDDLKYGNVSREELYSGDSDGSTDRTIRHAYMYNENLWIVGMPARTETYKGIGVVDGNKMSATYFIYDEIAACETPINSQNQTQSQLPTKGNLSRIVRWYKEKNLGDPDSEVRMTYNTEGHLACTRDAKGTTATISYDSATKTFPITATRAANKNIDLQITTTTQYYAGTLSEKGLYGQVKSVTDSNGVTSALEYDVFGRKSKVIAAVGTPNESTTNWSYPQLSEYGQVGTQNVLVSAGGIESSTYFDGFGRTIMQKKDGPGGRQIISKTDYNNTGVVTKSYVPHFEGDNALYTTYVYDLLGRTLRVNNPDMTFVKACFNEGVTIGVDANNHAKRTTKDGLGRLVKVEEFTGDFVDCNNPGSLYATTIYQYDILGQLLTVTDAENNTISMTYDSLGRKIAMNDPDMGAWAYAYDLNDNLKKQVDANGQTISFRYDEHNRVKFKDYPSEGTPVVTYTYDESWSENPKGRLTSMTDVSGNTKYYYDSMGRSKKVTKHVDGSDYTVQYAFDSLGRLKYLTYPYPDNDVVRYDYNADGSLHAVVNNVTGANYATYSGYNALGQLGNITYGNGISTDYHYRLDNNRLDSIFTNNGSQNLIALEYTYDNVGNITYINDNSAHSEPPPMFDEVASYDYRTDHNQPHAVQHNLATGTTYIYDPNGNMTAEGSKIIAYNSDNMPISITQGSNTTSFVYDGAGSRVKKTGSGGATVYIGKLYECNAGTCSKYIYAGNEKIAHKVGASNIVYYHSDHLGSTSAVSDSTGAKIEDIQYFPFGETRLDYGPTSMSHKYTSQELDAETGLYYYNARYYNPSLGRFISADTIVPNPANPQSFNRYSYVNNNPLLYIDPSGHSLRKWWNRQEDKIEGNSYLRAWLWYNNSGIMMYADPATRGIAIAGTIGFMQGGPVGAVASATSYAFLNNTGEGRQTTQQVAKEVFVDMLGMSRKWAYVVASAVLQQAMSAGLEAGYNYVTGVPKLSAGSEPLPKSEMKNPVYKDLLANDRPAGPGISGRSVTEIWEQNGEVYALKNGDEVVGLYAKDFASGSGLSGFDHSALIVKGTSGGYFNSMAGLGYGNIYGITGLCHNMSNQAFSLAGYSNTVFSMPGYGWSMIGASAIYGNNGFQPFVVMQSYQDAN